MKKNLAKVGNSRAVDRKHISFKEKVERLRENKARIYKKMKEQSLDPETLDYYENQSLEDIDVDILD